MRVFVTGATGFVGSAVVKQLLDGGHEVIGLARSDSSAKALDDAGALVHRGDIDDPENLRLGVAKADAVIHTAFNHDFSQFKANCEADRRVILSLGEALAGSDRPLVITSGVGLLHYDHPVAESDQPSSSAIIPRAATEEAAKVVADRGVNTYIVRLPPSVHGKGDHGFVPMVMAMAKEKGVSAFVGEGANRWPAVHRSDAAAIYRRIIELQPAEKTFHAVAEEGIPFRLIAAAIGKQLDLPAESRSPEAATEHFGWFTHFAMMDCPATASLSHELLSWKPTELTLLDDLAAGNYSDR
ncbi:SDR family oxidoreductase [Flavihumibacter petaseus]|nr:SDR family oxidoreductase [Flavihumibacter petaseus]